jgi:hypothetical protein
LNSIPIKTFLSHITTTPPISLNFSNSSLPEVSYRRHPLQPKLSDSFFATTNFFKSKTTSSVFGWVQFQSPIGVGICSPPTQILHTVHDTIAKEEAVQNLVNGRPLLSKTAGTFLIKKPPNRPVTDGGDHWIVER